jgi:hypothetical protein
MIKSVLLAKKTKLDFTVKKFDSNYLIVPNLQDLNKDAYYLVTFKKNKSELESYKLGICFTPTLNEKIEIMNWPLENQILEPRKSYMDFNLMINKSSTRKAQFLIPIVGVGNELVRIIPNYWRGFFIPEEELTNLVSIESIDDLSQFPIEPFIVIPENWREKNYYLTTL